MKTLQTRSWRKLLMVALLSLLVAWPCASALAATDSYPTKPVRLMIAFAPGGSTDAVGRLLATKLSERLGKQFVAENQAGGGGSMAAEMVSKAPPDGHTLLFHSSAVVINPLLSVNEPYDPFKSFTPVAKIGNSPSALVVHPSVQANTVKEFIALAKKEPGKLVSAASGGGSFIHLSTELFLKMAGIEAKIVQFKGGGPAMVDVIGGHSQFFLGSIQQSLPHIQSGKLRGLGYGGKTRSKLLPNMPTISEAGLKGYESFIWWAMYAPPATPKPVIDKLFKEIETIMKTPDMLKTLEVQGAEPDLMNGAGLTKFMLAETAKWGKVIKEGNIKLE